MFELDLKIARPFITARLGGVFAVLALGQVIDALGVYPGPGKAHAEELHLVRYRQVRDAHPVHRQVDQPLLVAPYPPATTEEHGGAQEKKRGEGEGNGGDDKCQLRGEQQKDSGEQVGSCRNILEDIAQQHFFRLLAHRRTLRDFFAGVGRFSATATRCRCGALTVCVVVPICV